MGKPKDWILLAFISIAVATSLVILIIKLTEKPTPTDFGMAIVTSLIVPTGLFFGRWVVNKFTEIDKELDKQGEKISKHEGYFETYHNVFNQFDSTRKHMEERFEETMTFIEKRIDLQDIKLGIDGENKSKKENKQ